MVWQDARRYMKLGFKVFPVRGTYDQRSGKWRKAPYFKGNGFKDATNDASRAKEMFPTDAWVGMVHDNMIVIDADGQLGVETLNRILPLLPEAAVVTRTISGSIHYIIPGTTGEHSREVRGLPGVDILTGNNKGFIVVPPSPGYRIITGSFEDLAEGINEQQLDGPTPVGGDGGEAAQ